MLKISEDHQEMEVTLLVHDINGKEIYSGKKHINPFATEITTWDATSMSEGIYFYQIKTSNGTSAQGKLIKMQ